MTNTHIAWDSEPLDPAASVQFQPVDGRWFCTARCTHCGQQFESTPDTNAWEQWTAHHEQTGHDGTLCLIGSL